jgi:hypothetical protein
VHPFGRAYGEFVTAARALGTVLQDLLRDDSQLLWAASKAALFAPQTTTAGASTGALGWVMGTVAGEPYFGKQGGALGFRANVRIYPARRLATVLLANPTDPSAKPIDARSPGLDALASAGQGPAPWGYTGNLSESFSIDLRT